MKMKTSCSYQPELSRTPSRHLSHNFIDTLLLGTAATQEMVDGACSCQVKFQEIDGDKETPGWLCYKMAGLTGEIITVRWVAWWRPGGGTPGGMIVHTAAGGHH